MKQSITLSILLLVASGAFAATNLSVDSSKPAGDVDLTKYALGQGGFCEKPMFDGQVDQIKQLHPQTIRVFLQEFFDLYPDHGKYDWSKLDPFIENVLATGAKPILNLCFKPKVLFPTIDQKIVHPNDYKEWEELIFQLVKHCNTDKKFGVEYWEISNEPDIGEGGGCPYLFQPADYLIYYDHTAAAIRRADAHAKIGGPALAIPGNAIGDALIEHCGKTDAPLDFFSWHRYVSNPQLFRTYIRDYKSKLAKYPRLKDCETMITEWNVNLFGLHFDPAFQPAFILENTLGFQEEGLSRSAYYHIRDSYVDPDVFAKFLSPQGTNLVVNYWNALPQLPALCGIWDNLGNVRPTYFAFKMLSQIRGQQITVNGTTTNVHALASKNDRLLNVLVWNYSPDKTESISLNIAGEQNEHRFFDMSLNVPANQIDTNRQGAIGELQQHPLEFVLPPYGIRWIAVGQ